jgi:hypothetical protein
MMEQRANITFHFRTGQTTIDTFQLIEQVYGNIAVLCTWFLMLFEGLNYLKMGMRIFRIIQTSFNLSKCRHSCKCP